MTDIETRLAAALKASASAITDENPPALRRPPLNNRRPVWLLVAAAAVVIGIAALVAVLRPRHDTAPRPAASHTPSISPSPSAVLPSPSAPPRGVRAATCQVAIPPVWRSALNQGKVTSPDGTGMAVGAVTDTGDVLTYEIAVGPANQIRGRYLYRVGSDNTAHRIYTTPTGLIGGVLTEGSWTVAVIYNSSGEGAPLGFVAINLHTLHAVTIRALSDSGSQLPSLPVLVGGRVYWSELDVNGAGRVRAYDLSAGAGQTLVQTDHGLTNVFGYAGGVYWTQDGALVTERAGDVPPGVRLAAIGNPAEAHEGGVQAYQLMPGAAVMLRVGTSASLKIVQPGGGGTLTVGAVLGKYLIHTVGSEVRVLDTRSGAWVDLGSDEGIAARDGRLGLTVSGGNAAHPVAVDLASLPALHC